jgi:hypothetical protein
MSEMMRSIQSGQLRLRVHRGLTWGITIDCNDSGGMFNLSQVATCTSPQGSRSQPDPDQFFSFTALLGGQQLFLVQRPHPTLLTLPQDVISRIMTELIDSLEELRIDLDVKTALPLGYFHTNKDLYDTY